MSLRRASLPGESSSLHEIGAKRSRESHLYHEARDLTTVEKRLKVYGITGENLVARDCDESEQCVDDITRTGNREKLTGCPGLG